MTLKQAFIYTISVFTLLCLLSYIAIGQQPRRLSLQEALELGLSNNREIRIASLDIQASEQKLQTAKSLALPSAGINAQLSHYFHAPAFFGFGSNGNSGDKIPYGRFGGNDQALASLFVSQPLYNAGIKPSLQYAKLAQRSAKLSVADKRNIIAAALKQTYIRTLVLNERIRLQKESIQRNEKALRDARSLLAQGRALRVDTLRAYTSVKNLEPGLLKLTYAVEVSEQQLKTLMGVDSVDQILLTDSLSLPAPSGILSEEEAYKEASAQRADLKTLALQEDLADQRIKLAAAPMKPSVSLQAQYLLQTQVNDFNYFNGLYPSTPYIGAQIAVPLFNGNANKAKIKQAKIEKEQSSLRSANAYEELRAEVKQAVANVRETTARIQTSVTVKESALLSYDITQYRYAKGVASRLELTDAELALTAAQSNYLEAVFDYLSARIVLDAVTGKTGE